MPYGNRQLLLFNALAFFRSFPFELLRRWAIAVMNAATWVGTDFDDLPALSSVH